MNVEIRACRDRDELQAYGRVVGYVFAENDSERVASEIESMQLDWTLCAFVDGEVAATMGTWPFTVRLNGTPVPMGGVTQVGTLPQHRRKGLLRQLMRQGLGDMRDRGQPYAILWASMGAIYQRFGYGLASELVSYQFDPRFAQRRTGAEPNGSVTLYNVEDGFPIAKQLYVQWATPRNLHLHRATVLWQMNTLRPRNKGEQVHIAVYRNADGEPRGHVVYRTWQVDRAGPGPSQVLEVKDLVWLDLEAWCGLWDYVCRHDLVGTVRMGGCLSTDDPAPDVLLEPRVLDRRVGDGIWMRVVDVEKAMVARPYGARGELTFAVEGDDMCPWNNGTYLLETDGLTSGVCRVDRAPELTVDPNSLATLLSGLRSATHLSRSERLAARGPEALIRADSLFRTEYPPNCPNDF